MAHKDPQSRNETILQNILGEMHEILPAQSRVEAILQSILYNTEYTAEAQSRIEELLLAIKNGGSFDDEARSRNEAILLAKLNGTEYTAEPQSRIEELLIEWLNAEPSWVLKTVSGSIVSVDDAIAAPAEELIADINAVQTGSGDPSPSNVRPIIGENGMTICKRGANLWDEEWELGSISTVTGAKVAADTTIRTKNNIKVKANKKYTIVKIIGYPFYVLFYDKNGNVVQYVPQTGDTPAYNMSAVIDANATNATFTTPNNTDYILIRFNSMTSYSGGISVNYPSTDTTYHAYNSNSSSIAVDWTTEAGTVYGGSLNLTTGVLTVTLKQLDVSQMNWNSGNPSESGFIRFINRVDISDKAVGFNLLCDKFPVKNSLIPSQPTEIGISGYSDNSYIYIAVPTNILSGDLTTLAGRNSAFKDWISTNGLQVIYELATPIEITLTPEELVMFEGINNILADTGDITLTYKAQA